MDFKAIKAEFLAEADDLLAQVERYLLDWERDQDARGTLHAIFRAIHTLKGNAQVLGFDALAGVAHAFEDALAAIREGRTTLSAGRVSLLLQGVDAMREGSRRAVAGDAPGDAPEQLLEALRQIAYAPGKTPPPQVLPSNEDSIAPPETANTASLRVPIERLDRMVDLIGEVAIGRERIQQMMSEIAGSEALRAFNKDLDHLYAELQELAMQMRMVAVGPVFQQFVRVARDTAALVGKQAHLEVSDHEVELDARVIGQLRGGLTHLVRNAVVHGIELPEVRAALGKPREGRITLSARHEAGGVVIELADDGGGFDLERIQARAIERYGGAAERLASHELIRLTLNAGFSTAETVTGLAGRGVGLDVVLRQVEALHGRLDFTSEPGRGSRFVIRLPLTLSIIDGFAVRAAGETYIVPMDSVVECLSLPTTHLAAPAAGHVERHGVPIPFVRLRKVFGLRAPPPSRESILIVESGEGRFGMAIDELGGEMQTVIKPLQGLTGTRAITGSAILGNGRVALIVDVNELHGLAKSQLS